MINLSGILWMHWTYWILKLWCKWQLNLLKCNLFAYIYHWPKITVKHERNQRYFDWISVEFIFVAISKCRNIFVAVVAHIHIDASLLRMTGKTLSFPLPGISINLHRALDMLAISFENGGKWCLPLITLFDGQTWSGCNIKCLIRSKRKSKILLMKPFQNTWRLYRIGEKKIEMTEWRWDIFSLVVLFIHQRV